MKIKNVLSVLLLTGCGLTAQDALNVTGCRTEASEGWGGAKWTGCDDAWRRPVTTQGGVASRCKAASCHNVRRRRASTQGGVASQRKATSSLDAR
jgi:hypothetical protein